VTVNKAMQENMRAAVGSALGFDDRHFHSSSTGNYGPLADLIPSELESDWRETNDLKNKIVALIADAEQSDEYEVSQHTLIAQKRKRAFSNDIMDDVQPQGFFSTLNNPPTATFDPAASSESSRHVRSEEISLPHGNLDTIVIANLPSTILIAGNVGCLASGGKSPKKARSSTQKPPRSSKPDAIPWDDW
jgi:hypothetical protein